MIEWLPTYFRAWCTKQNFLRVQECYRNYIVTEISDIFLLIFSVMWINHDLPVFFLAHEYSETDGNRKMPNFDDLTPDEGGSSKKGGSRWVWILLVIFLLVGLSACGYFGYNYYKENSGNSLCQIHSSFYTFLVISIESILVIYS